MFLKLMHEINQLTADILRIIIYSNFLYNFTTASRTVLGPNQPPIRWIPGALSLRVKLPGREADHSPPSRAEVKECAELYLHSRSMSSWRGAQLKHRDKFTLTFTGSASELHVNDCAKC